MEDASGGGDVAVFIRDNLAGDGQEIVHGICQRLARASFWVVGMRAPEGLRGGKVLIAEVARCLDFFSLAGMGGSPNSCA